MFVRMADNDTVIHIDCDVCVMAGTRACDDCLVTFLCDSGRPGERSVVVTLDEIRALRALSDGGLAPRLRHRARASPA
jgi:hypothetical protein